MLIDTIVGMDKILESDIEKNTVMLVEGTTGSLKTALAFSIMSELTHRTNTKGYYLTLEESKDSLLSNMQKMGITNTSNIEVCDLGMARKERENLEDADFTDAIIKGFEKYSEKNKNVSCFALDSLNALYAIDKPKDSRLTFFHFIQTLRGLGMFSLVLSETPLPGRSLDWPLTGVEEFICDSVIELGVDQSTRRAKRFIQVRKMRGVRHSIDRFWIEAKDGLRIIGELF